MTADFHAKRGAPHWQTPVCWLPRALLEPKHPLWAVVIGWLTAFVPSILLSLLVSQLLPTVGQPEFDVTGVSAILLLAVMAPVLETLIMGAVLTVLLRFLPPTAAVLASAIGWGVAHSAVAGGWGLVIWWPFLIFSTLFVTWRQRSVSAALAIAAATHGLQNLLPALLLFFGLSE